MGINENHWMVMVLVLKNIAKDKGITQQEIADRTGLQRSNVNRMFSLKYPCTLQTFMKVAQAIEVNFFFEDKEGVSELNLAFNRAMEELGRRGHKLSKN